MEFGVSRRAVHWLGVVLFVAAGSSFLTIYQLGFVIAVVRKDSAISASMMKNRAGARASEAAPGTSEFIDPHEADMFRGKGFLRQ
jgi:hypothetical protein